MESFVEFLSEYRYLVLFLTIFVAQVMMVFPIVPVLLSTGVLVGEGALNAAGAVLALAGALVLADLVWYELGRWRGGRVLGLACRLALEPDVCVRRVEGLFARHGARLLLVARFVPGLITAALPLAGMFRMRRRRFVLYDTIGVLLWCTAYTSAGILFAPQLSAAAGQATRLGEPLAILVLGALAAYIGWRYIRRQRFLRRLRVARVEPAELHRRIQAGENLMILDLRHPMDFESDPYTIPGALYIPAEELARRHREIPRKRDIILYCT